MNRGCPEFIARSQGSPGPDSAESDVHAFFLTLPFSAVGENLVVQGGSNMTGTEFCVNKPHMSRSYLNHLVLLLPPILPVSSLSFLADFWEFLISVSVTRFLNRKLALTGSHVQTDFFHSY